MDLLDTMRRVRQQWQRRPLPACPRCGSRESVRIVLGQPRPDLPKRGGSPSRFPFGRPSLGIDHPDRVCKRCGQQWRSGGL